MKKPSVSVIIPVYNAEKTLKSCLDSVLAQTYSDFEMILVNDGSEDRGGIICDEYALSDQRIRVVHQNNRGVSCARNYGIKIARGAYIIFLDSDDWISSTHLERYCQAITQYSCEVVIGGFIKSGCDGDTYCGPDEEGCFGSEIWESICRDPVMFGYPWNKLFCTSLLKKHSIFFREDMYSQEDLDFCLSAIEKADRIALIPSDSYHYCYLPSKRKPPFWDFIANQLKMIHIATNKIDLSDEAVNSVMSRVLSLLYTSLYSASEQGDFTEMICRLEQLEGLREMLGNVKARGEYGFVARSFAKGHIAIIRLFFVIRNVLRDFVRSIRRYCKPKR